jgi:hypothetical protein
MGHFVCGFADSTGALAFKLEVENPTFYSWLHRLSWPSASDPAGWRATAGHDEQPSFSIGSAGLPARMSRPGFSLRALAWGHHARWDAIPGASARGVRRLVRQPQERVAIAPPHGARRSLSLVIGPVSSRRLGPQLRHGGPSRALLGLRAPAVAGSSVVDHPSILDGDAHGPVSQPWKAFSSPRTSGQRARARVRNRSTDSGWSS